MIDDQNILVPGRGLVNLKAERVNRAVMEYDERLRFGFNPVNNDYIIYIKMPRDFEAYYYIEGEPVYPCIGFGDEIPDPGEAVVRLQQADTWRHGATIYNRVMDSQARVRANQADEADAVNQDVAERLTHKLRKEGII